MSKTSQTTDLLNAARIAAIIENDAFLIYLIDMAIERSKAINTLEIQQTV